MPWPLFTAGGFGLGEHPEWRDATGTLAPDAVPKLAAMAVCLLLLGLWFWDYLRSLER